MKKKQQRTRAALRATAVQSCVLPRKAKFSGHGLPAMHPTSRASHQPRIPPALPPGGAGTTQCHSQDHAAWLLIPNTGFSNSPAYGPESQAGASTLLWHHCLVTQKTGTKKFQTLLATGRTFKPESTSLLPSFTPAKLRMKADRV